MIIKNNFNRCNCECPICVGVKKGSKSINKIDDKDLNDLLKDLDLNLGKVNKIYPMGKISHKVLYVIGLGDGKLTKADLRKVFYKIGLIDEDKLQIDLESFGKPKEIASLLAYQLNYANYSFKEFKENKEEKEKIYKFISDVNISEDIYDGLVLSNATNNTRDLVNKPYNVLNAIDLANYCVDLVKDINNDKLTIEVLGLEEIKKLNMGSFLSVNKGSLDEPRLICMKYNGAKDEDYTALVGKGIMFDTGGYSLKSDMTTMKDDMTGAATVIGVIEAAARLNKEVNLYSIICATDNRIDGLASVPDDVVKSAKGLTIEIISTDAEGRLTLVDAVWYAQQKGCKKVIDVATLTGACVVALGDATTGVFSNDQKYVEKFLKSTIDECESAWQMPITDTIRDKVRDSKIADLKNSTGRMMGASGAAAFIEAFVEKGTKWIHLDIAGTAYHTAPYECEKYGATGVMVRSLFNFVLNK